MNRIERPNASRRPGKRSTRLVRQLHRRADLDAVAGYRYAHSTVWSRALQIADDDVGRFQSENRSIARAGRGSPEQHQIANCAWVIGVDDTPAHSCLDPIGQRFTD